ncbi:MAG TPA: hypothetical protein VEY30_05445 [Myxococcaceae bacterium]|nr:hypothetical protein [Myxococcaceae bacterium]
MKITASSLIRWSGLAAMAAGLIFAGIQPIHPSDVVASVTTGEWAIITTLKLAMCLLFLLGIAGIYARQVERAGWLGLAGFLLLTLSWWLQTAFVFAEAYILPQLATTAPKFVDGTLGTLAAGRTSKVDLGALPAIYSLGVGIPYMLGGLLFGIATLRAGILPRWPAGLLAVAALVTPAAALLPHDIQRLAAIPVGLALAWLGYALWSERSERRAQASDPAPRRRRPQLR